MQEPVDWFGPAPILTDLETTKKFLPWCKQSEVESVQLNLDNTIFLMQPQHV